MKFPHVSDRALRTLVVSCRTGSFTSAAKKLGVGQPAVSHAIRSLEDAVGATLVERSRSGVRPTAIGQALLDDIAPSFDHIDRAVAGLANQPIDVTLTVSTSLAHWWLLPRLPEFKRAHPDVSLRLMTADSDSSVDLQSVDLWIPLGRIDRPDVSSIDLCREALIPIASPEVAKTIGPKPADLLRAPLIHLEEQYEPRFDWAHWFAANDLEVEGHLAGDRSNDYSLVVQAALDGQGVALGWEHIVQDLIDDGRLVPLAPAILTERPFVALNLIERPLSPNALALRTWLVNELAGR